METKKISTFAFLWLIFPFLISLFLIFSLLNSLHPFFDSLADIRIYLAILLFLSAAPLLFSKLRRISLSFILFAIILLTMSWQTGGIQPSPEVMAQKQYTLLQANLRFDNAHTQKLVDLINQEKPDFITYQEGAKQWQTLFNDLKSEYPYQVECPRLSSIIGSTGILSRHPFSAQTMTHCPLNEAVAMGQFQVDGQDITILSIHLHWPWPYRQHAQIDDLATVLKIPNSDNRLVSGDFNAVTWSDSVKRIESLTNTRHISSIGSTWLSYKIPAVLRPYFGLPIDQVLVSSPIHVLSAQLASPTGSDHLPIKVIFEIPIAKEIP